MANGWAALWRDPEPGRWPLWLPVALGAGAGSYFALAAEPSAAWGWAGLGGGLILAALATGLTRGRAVLALVAALLLGFGLAKEREMRVAAPVLDHSIVAHLTGRVRHAEPRRGGQRLVLDSVRSGAFGDAVPSRVRLAVRGGAQGNDFKAGDWLSLTARLAPPPAPSEPGANDTGRSLFFQSIGAVGFVYGRARAIVPARPPNFSQALSQKIERLRSGLTARILAALPGSVGGIAAALITGTRGAIAQDDEAALRDAGLAHVLAIAGLHMALVGGGIFWLLRAMLAAIPALALRYPIKKWAAAAALAASAFYLVISGAAAPAVRAFVMLATAMVAVLLDRPALSMRSLALAAAILLIARPESVIEPGFQMSFAAVVALVAVAEWAQQRQRRQPRGALLRYARGIVLVSLVGSLATLPFALFHFDRASHYAVLGNLLAMPVMGFWVMPAAALSVALMPFGLEGLSLHLLGAGIGAMLAVGHWVSSLPGAVSLSPAMPLAALLLIAAGGLWLALWQRPKRWLGLAPLAVGAALAWWAPVPDMLVAPDGLTVAVRGDDGLLHFLRPPADRFIARAWLQRDGDNRAPPDAVGMAGLRCDGLGCAVKRGGVLIAASVRADALADDCDKAQLVVSAVAAGKCIGPALVLDRDVAKAGQGWRITLSSPPAAQSVRSWRGQRPWVPPVSNAE